MIFAIVGVMEIDVVAEEPTANWSKRGKSRGGMIIRFTDGRESDLFWECRRLWILTAFRTPT